MPHSSRHHGSPWTPVEMKALRQLARGNTPTRLIALKLDRTPSAIYSKAAKMGLSLEPANQSPYGLRSR